MHREEDLQGEGSGGMPDTPSTQLRFSKSFWKHRFFQDAGDEEDTYVFPTEKLSPEAPADSGKQNILLVACGSFSPLTYMHLRMFGVSFPGAPPSVFHCTSPCHVHVCVCVCVL